MCLRARVVAGFSRARAAGVGDRDRLSKRCARRAFRRTALQHFAWLIGLPVL